MTTETAATPPTPSVTLAEAFAVFLRIGLLSFGGPAAQIALMHRVLVDEHRWLTEQQYRNALGFCMLLPGPEAMQLATYAGWRLHGTVGGLIAGLLFVLPGAVVIFALSTVYAFFGDVSLVDALFLGVKAAVLVIVLQALLRISQRALKTVLGWVIAVAAFAGIFFLSLPFPLIVLAAAVIGFVAGGEAPEGDRPAGRTEASIGKTAIVVVTWLALWLIPLALIGPLTGAPILTDIGSFFARLAVVTFGGAYAVLAYMAQDVVTAFGWLTAGEMLDGLGLAETTPGPLILVTQFVGFLAAFRDGGITLAIIGAIVTLWATFVPCFLWIFAGAPYIEWISAQPRLAGALSAISAAVVGVILNLSIWFALHVFFASVSRETYGPLTLWLPELTTIDWRVCVLAIVCGVLTLRLNWGIGRVLAVASVLGLVVVQLT